MKTTTIDINDKMNYWKNKFPSYRDGGPNWNKI